MNIKTETLRELMELSPADKRGLANLLRDEALKDEERMSGEKGTTVAAATDVLEQLRGLDAVARKLIIRTVAQEDREKEDTRA